MRIDRRGNGNHPAQPDARVRSPQRYPQGEVAAQGIAGQQQGLAGPALRHAGDGADHFVDTAGMEQARIQVLALAMVTEPRRNTEKPASFNASAALTR